MLTTRVFAHCRTTSFRNVARASDHQRNSAQSRRQDDHKYPLGTSARGSDQRGERTAPRPCALLRATAFPTRVSLEILASRASPRLLDPSCPQVDEQDCQPPAPLQWPCLQLGRVSKACSKS